METDLKLAMIMLVLNDQQKILSSREGMKRCTETSSNFQEWIRQSAQDYQDMLAYLKDNDFEKVGGIDRAECSSYAFYNQDCKSTPSPI